MNPAVLDFLTYFKLLLILSLAFYSAYKAAYYIKHNEMVGKEVQKNKSRIAYRHAAYASYVNSYTIPQLN